MEQRGRRVRGQLQLGAAAGGVEVGDVAVRSGASGLVVGDHQPAVGAAIDAVDRAAHADFGAVGQSNDCGWHVLHPEPQLAGHDLCPAGGDDLAVVLEPGGELVTLP